MNTSKTAFFLKKIWNLSQTGVIITKTWNSKIRITARISSLALIFFVLVDCVLRLRESKLSNSFRIFLGSKWTWFANFERKTPQKLRLLVFMHFIEIRTFFYGFMYFGAKLWVADPPGLLWSVRNTSYANENHSPESMAKMWIIRCQYCSRTTITIFHTIDTIIKQNFVLWYPCCHKRYSVMLFRVIV